MWPVLTFIRCVCYANWPNSIEMQQKETAKGTSSSEAPVMAGCPLCGCSHVENLVKAMRRWPGAGGLCEPWRCPPVDGDV